MDEQLGDTIFNPARRLHDLITEFLGMGSPGKTTVIKRWREVLDLEDADLGTVLLAYSEVVRLPARARTILHSLDEYPEHIERMLEPLPVFEAVFRDTALQSGAQAYPQHFTGEVLAKLDTAAMAIERHLGRSPGRDRDSEQAAHEVREELERIRAAVADDRDLAPEVRAYLLRHLSSLSDALALYTVDGIAPVIDALDMMRGHDERQPDVAKKARATRWWQEAQDAVRTFHTLVTIAAQLGLPFVTPPAIEAPRAPTPAVQQADPDDTPGGLEP